MEGRYPQSLREEVHTYAWGWWGEGERMVERVQTDECNQERARTHTRTAER